MEHGQIKDSQIRSSPAHNNEYLAHYGRLNAVLENSRGCWCPSNDDRNAWFQVEFTVDTTVTSVRTQGNPASNVDERVTTFEVSYSLDGGEFVYYKENGLVKVGVIFDTFASVLVSYGTVLCGVVRYVVVWYDVLWRGVMWNMVCYGVGIVCDGVV
jgi:hypothetical protein